MDIYINLLLGERIIALFNNMRTLKFKTKVTITFYAAVNRNGHPKAETSKCCKWIEIRQSRTRSVTCWPLWNIALVSWEVRDMIDGSVNIEPASHCYPNNQSKQLKKFHFPRVSPGDQTADQGAWGLWVRDCSQWCMEAPGKGLPNEMDGDACRDISLRDENHGFSLI